MGKKVLSVALIAVVGIVALIGGLVASMGYDDAVALVSGSKANAPEVASGGTGKAAGQPGAGDTVIVTPFKEIIVNISATTATGRQTTRFLKLNTALVYDETAPGADHIEERKEFVRDAFQDYLRQLSERDVQGSAGLAILKAELLRRARSVTGTDAAQEILISDLIIQ
ncbi:flagellar basal body-associated protein FliL [Pseudooceanicola sp.]|uniref:flagellar basal body-associated protein FliL n=1 Tax=Pseudooceanicola sp. TaxID=1914328 RepID=UPI0035C73AE7